MPEPAAQVKHTLLITLISALLFAASFVKIPVADKLADNYFSESIQAATIAYATTRGVNAVVSVVKESHLELAPAGVGITIAAGQILDPIDDMTERLSSVLVAAIASLGIQKIGFEISEVISFKVIAIILLLSVPMIWLNKTGLAMPLLKLAIKFCLILLLLRFMLPASALISHSLYANWLQPGIADSMQKLSIISESYDKMSNMPPEQSQGFFSSMTASAADKVENTRKAFLTMVENAEHIINSLLQLMTAYLTIFVVQVLLLPLLMLWLIAAMFKSRTLDEFTVVLTNKLVPVHS
ncbi:hypothetical protein MMIC_P1849 [Mariprofundus micogutta]|uniref:Uncharacterized protein n=1 Tax=Mariprofundus micogutta TaxID=1921010 RepID=A0A1L8CPR6_9PROT|nr:hypothetical protein [Mariprofundus micogutta]GAV20874.1 hypothetical protein MMIC_P1849 [Mariprofundus micogutta]